MPGEIAGRGSSNEAGAKRVSGEFDATLPYAHSATEPLQVGMPLSPLAKEITQEQASIFSRSGEYVRNIHNDLDIAKKSGLQIPIVQGQQQCCLITELLTRFFGSAWFTNGWVRCKFVQPVEVFEPLTVGGVVAGVRDNTVDLEVWVRRGDQKLSTVGWASCAAPHERSAR